MLKDDCQSATANSATADDAKDCQSATADDCHSATTNYYYSASADFDEKQCTDESYNQGEFMMTGCSHIPMARMPRCK